MKKELEKTYNPRDIEDRLYQKWEEKKYFHAEVDKTKKPFTIVIPPPNITGKLHMGHAFDQTLQDILIRWKRMQGFNALWQPGTDHASIATEVRITDELKKQGIDKRELGREKFLEKAWEWKAEYSDFIRSQWAKLGNSTDYRKERFTLDEGLSRAVSKVFVTYYKEGLIYQGARVINWDPQAKTALSNIEVIHKDVKAYMYYIRYHIVGSDETFEVATTRPETMFGDVCIVVNPNDEKVNHLIGKKAINPANGQELPIIGDEYIEIGFGTGIMKCTPAHDPNDYQIALRHNLEMPICMNEDGTMNELCGEFNGLDRFECREKLLEKYKEEGAFVKAEEIVHSVGHSERTGVMVEPYLSKQWFVKMKPLAEDVLKAQQDPETKINFYPKRFEKTFNQWLENIEVWCISRQLWWGHRIPVWYHNETGEIYCEVDPPADIENYVQDEDVLDTWFSSALWPFSVLGWPEQTEDLKRYYPTSCMVTGYDIIFFWVARMAFSARHFTDDVPFKDCLIHGLIRDEKGRKMSKSLGNGIDPIDLIDRYGADSLRLFLSTNSTPGLDMNYSNDKMEASWNFINKLWNASRYVLMNCDETYKYEKPAVESEIDCWIMNRLNSVIRSATANLDKYELAIAGNEIENFVWNDFCSMYIEFTKSSLNSEDIDVKHRTLDTLIYVLEAILKLMHPFIPFVTEEIYQSIHGKEKSIMLETWPEVIDDIDEEKAESIESIIEIIENTRTLRTENNIKPSQELHIIIDGMKMNDSLASILYRMTKLNIIADTDKETIVRPTRFGKTSYIMDEIVDRKSELEKIEKELSRLQSEIERSNGMLNNERFISKAPKEKVEEERKKLVNYQNSYDTLMEKKKEYE
ncbi:MAG: valine--tRNA ligase [Erysipelotrichaceae bacterium]|nr:valine--tRNA ligase [Erysipelotrichaceae bacterium]